MFFFEEMFVECSNSFLAFVGHIRHVAVDEVHGLLYWSDAGAIFQATLNGSNPKRIFGGKLNISCLVISCQSGLPLIRCLIRNRV